MVQLYDPDTNSWYENSQYTASREAWESAGLRGSQINQTSLDTLASGGYLGRDSSGSIVSNPGGYSGGRSRSSDTMNTRGGGGAAQRNIPVAAAVQPPVVAPIAPQLANVPLPVPRPANLPGQPQAPGAIPVNPINMDPIGQMPTWLEFSAFWNLPAPGPNSPVKDQSRLPAGSGLDFQPTEVVNNSPGIMVGTPPLPRPRPQSDMEAAASVPYSQGTPVPLYPNQSLPELPRSQLMNAVLQDRPPANRAPSSHVTVTDLPPLSGPGQTGSTLANIMGTNRTVALPTPKPAEIQRIQDNTPPTVRDETASSRYDSQNQNPTRAVLDMIARAEGTHEDLGYRGYNETLGYGAFTGGNVNLTGMTLREVQQLQRDMLNNPRNNLNSSAVGRYQIVSTTMRDLINQMGLTGDELFDERMQDRMAEALLERRGASSYRSGRISEQQFLDNLSLEWASLPRYSGGTSYGQRQGATRDEVLGAVSLMRKF